MTTEQIELGHWDLQDGDYIIRTHGGGQFLVERDVPEPFEVGTIVAILTRSGRPVGAPIARHADDHWYVTSTGERADFNDALIRGYINDRFDQTYVLYDPKEHQ